MMSRTSRSACSVGRALSEVGRALSGPPQYTRAPMRLCRFDNNRLGLVEDGHVRDVTAALDVLPAYRYPLPPGDVLIANLDAVAARARAIAKDSAPVPI